GRGCRCAALRRARSRASGRRRTAPGCGAAPRPGRAPPLIGCNPACALRSQYGPPPSGSSNAAVAALIYPNGSRWLPRLVAALTLALYGCSTQLDGIPSGGGVGGGGSSSDGGMASDAAPVGDLSSAPASPDLGAVGAACQTACDCQSGLACRRGKCAM